MNRLTDRDYRHHSYCPQYLNKYGAKELTEKEHKLGQLEDIEEELGIDLITLFNKYIKWQPLENYYKSNNDWVLVLCKDKLDGLFYKLPYIAELRRDNKWYSEDDICLNDYLEIIAWKPIDVMYECGKLTKEELEEELENE